MAEAAAADREHDDLLRGTYAFLTAGALLLGGPRAVQYLRLRDLLLPEGLEAVQRTYRGQAGEADLLKARLGGDEEARRLLMEIPVHGTPLGTFGERWVAAAERIGQLEDDQVILEAAAEKGEGMAMVNARLGWIRVVTALLINAELAGFSEEDDTLRLGRSASR